jgi:hypothetical protein
LLGCAIFFILTGGKHVFRAMPTDHEYATEVFTKLGGFNSTLACRKYSMHFSFFYDQLSFYFLSSYFNFLVEYPTLVTDFAELRDMAQKSPDVMSQYVKDRSGLSDKAVSFLTRIFTHFYTRPTADDLLEDPFFAALRYLLFYFMHGYVCNSLHHLRLRSPFIISGPRKSPRATFTQ